MKKIIIILIFMYSCSTIKEIPITNITDIVGDYEACIIV